jgi:cytochrome c oxidase assembly protein subunit 15
MNPGSATMTDVRSTTRVAWFAWLTLAYTIGVILWGAYVRASGSGAGCGDHWPLCNGVVIPREASVATLIEYSHRLTSGLALVFVVALLAWVWRACAPGHPARKGAALSVVFMLLEAAIGAGIVLFQYVADNESMARALWMAVHLANTFILIGWITLTAWWLTQGPPESTRRSPGLIGYLVVAAIGLLLVGSSGAVAALGDTLFPHGSLAEAVAADLSPTSHLLIRLRFLHPTFAVLTAVGLIFGAPRLARHAGDPARRLAIAVAVLSGVQLFLGAVNVILLAPVWMQMVHLLFADLVWIAFVLMGAALLEGRTHLPSGASAA